jgi:hypothetical protein
MPYKKQVIYLILLQRDFESANKPVGYICECEESIPNWDATQHVCLKEDLNVHGDNVSIIYSIYK